MTNPPPPNTLTRFYSNSEYALELIAQKQITLVHADKLNDPFDPYFYFETDFGENYSELIKWIKANHPSDVSWFRARVPCEKWLAASKDLKDRLSAWRRSMYVLSMCSEHEGLHPMDNLYMWGHYANGHRGLAIEFNTANLARSVVDENVRMTGKPVAVDEVWAKMRYEEKFSPATCRHFYEFFKATIEAENSRSPVPRRTILDEHYELMGCIKSKVWEREHEWRLMWNNDETKLKIHKCPIGGDAIQSVFIGLNASSQTQADILFEARRNFPEAVIYQASRRPSDFSLNFQVISK